LQDLPFLLSFSSDRYAEHVIPLLVQAQRKIAKRIASVGGPPLPQPEFRNLTLQLGHMVTVRDYLTLQLKVHCDPARVKLIQPGAQIDPLGHNTYSGIDLLSYVKNHC
jgi:hypothetical protein